MLRDLERGVTLVVDRYLYSGVAYSVAKGLPLSWCQEADRSLPRPDLVIYLDIVVESAALRGHYGKERFEQLSFQRKVKEAYQRQFDASFWRSISAAREVEQVHQDVLREVHLMKT